MSTKQLKKVVQAEAAAYVLVGSTIGGVLGLILHRIFFKMMVTSNWGQTWQPPFRILAIIIFASILTTFISVIAPTRKFETLTGKSAAHLLWNLAKVILLEIQKMSRYLLTAALRMTAF